MSCLVYYERLDSSMISANQREEAQVTAVFSQVRETYVDPVTEILLSIFVGQGKQTGNYSKNLGIGYVAGRSSAYNEALEECLHISELVNGAPVMGMHCSSGIKCCKKVLRIEEASLQLLKIWKEFFESHSKGSYLQYFYGDGGNIVHSALSRSPYRNHITVVGINPVCLSDHDHAYYFRSKGSCSLQHGVTTLLRHPDAQGICTLRINDPTFCNALRSPFLELMEIENVDFTGQNNYALPDMALVDTVHNSSNVQHTQLLREDVSTAVQRSHSGRQIHRLVNAVFSFLKLTGYIALPSIQCFPKALQVAITTQPYTAKSLSLVTTTFPSEFTKKTKTTVKPGLVIPGGIFPCGVRPDGRFSFYANCSHCNQTYPYGYFTNRSFPYERFFSGKLTGKGKPVLLKLNDPLRDNLNRVHYATNVPPCNITADGIFHNHGHDYAPYGNFRVGARHDLLWMHSPKSGFPFERFFNGSLLLRNNEGGRLPDEDPIMQNVKYNNLTNWTLPDIYPGNIFPNGSFLDLGLAQPFGAFNDNFPYKKYFFGNFSYEEEFMKHLKEQRSTSTITSSKIPTLFSTSATALSTKISSLESSTSSARTRVVVDTFPRVYHGFSGVDYLLTGFWSMHVGCELLLVGSANRQGLRKIKAIALGISCGATYAQIVDLLNNIVSIATDPCDTIIRSSLCVYSSIAILKDVVRFSVPFVREQYYSISRAITYFNAPKSNTTTVNALYREEQKNSRITSAFLGILITGLIGILVEPKVNIATDTNQHVASVYGTIQTILVAFIALILAVFLILRYRFK